MNSRVLCWFSCGDASAVAAKMAVDKYGDACEICYCDTFAYEHPDNRRFLADIEHWVGKRVTVLRSKKYSDIWDVFTRERFLNSPYGARCTTEMKKNVRREYQKLDDIHIFGYTYEESRRISRLRAENPEIIAEFPLYEAGITKDVCHQIIREAGIELPAMYRLGYRNNNCIGCVKGGVGYWNKIRRDFPQAFDRMAKMEREIDYALCGTFLDEIKPDMGRYQDEGDIECGVLCLTGEWK